MGRIISVLSRRRFFLLVGSLFASANLTKGEAAAAPKLFPVIKLDNEQAKQAGYERISVELGDTSLNFNVLVNSGVQAEVVETPSEIEPPGRATVATLFVPQKRDEFAISVVALRPDFAAEAPISSEQILFEEGYSIADSKHQDLSTGESFGLIREGGIPAKAARSICANRGEFQLCFVIEFDAEHEKEGMEQAAAFAGSIAFEDGQPNAFSQEQLEDLSLPLGDGQTLTFRRPTAWAVITNSFKGDLPGSFAMVHGDASNPTSGLTIEASEGEAPKTVEGFDVVSQKMAQKFVNENSSLFANPKLISSADIPGVDPSAIPSRSYAFVADKVGDAGQVQLQFALAAKDNRRYAVMVVTHYSPKVDDVGSFFVRLAGLTAFDLATEGLVKFLNAR